LPDIINDSARFRAPTTNIRFATVLGGRKYGAGIVETRPLALATKDYQVRIRQTKTGTVVSRIIHPPYLRFGQIPSTVIRVSLQNNFRPAHPFMSKVSNFSSPRYLLTWTGLILWRLLSMLPLPVLYCLGVLLGELFHLSLRKRRHITARNIDLCFGELSKSEKAVTVRKCFRRAAQSLFDTGVAAWSSSERFDRMVDAQGIHNIEDLISKQRNIILLAPHFVCVGACALYLAQRYPVFAIYKPPSSPLFAAAYRRATAAEPSGHRFLDWLMAPVHKRGTLGLIEHRGPMKPMVRRLRSGDVLYYPSDQSLGNRQTVIAPFFGIDTPSISAASRLTRLSKAAIVPCALFQKPYGRGYRLVVEEAFELSGDIDEVAETTLINQRIENLVRRHPEQYFWLHRRFKTADPGQKSVYSKVNSKVLSD